MSDIYGVVYFIGARTSGPVKVGFTTDRFVSSRLSNLQTGSHEELVVLGQVEAGPTVERAIHNLLSSHAVRGEWFEREPALAVYARLNDTATHGHSVFVSRLARASDVFLACDAADDSLEFKVARDLVFDVTRDLSSVNTDKPLPFCSWLKNQTERDDPTGDLAKDFASDPLFPSLGNLETYLAFVVEKGSGSAITRTVVEAWIECDIAISSLPYSE
ncbi:MAG: GIY-YIG nuclease family protein [Pseudomonadota bacterium]